MQPIAASTTAALSEANTSRTAPHALARKIADGYVPLSFAPGEAYQFDWSHEVVPINGTTVTAKVAHMDDMRAAVKA